MIQRFIELGEGFADIYELIELAHSSKHRVKHLLSLHTTVNERKVVSLAVILNPSGEGKFQPIYISLEGIPDPNITPNQRYQLFERTAEELGYPIIKMDVKPTTVFPEKELYYQHLIAILRLNHFIPPLQ